MVSLKAKKEDLVEKVNSTICKPFVMEKQVIYLMPSRIIHENSKKFYNIIQRLLFTFFKPYHYIPFTSGIVSHGPYCEASKNLSKKEAAKICPLINMRERKKGNRNYYFACSN